MKKKLPVVESVIEELNILVEGNIEETTKVPPIKIQGIKTKLVQFIKSSIEWDGQGRWVEPFLGSGVVLFNMQPQKALISDNNKHIIQFFQQVQSGEITVKKLKAYLEYEGDLLEKRGGPHYYEVRKRFNQTGNSYDFIFLNRACFNGVMRFNGKGGFNVPFCNKPERYRQAYITKICNQVKWIIEVMKDKDWEFKVQEWQATLDTVTENDFVYLDPPYVGRHADYFNKWEDNHADALAEAVKALPCGFAYSMWKENSYRKNELLIIFIM
jgi:DNA adenine methylase